MATAQILINAALRRIGAIASGETPTGSESTDALETLNAMLDAWRTERLYTWAFTDTSFVSTGASSYTVGPLGNLVLTARPSSLDQVYVSVSGIDYPVNIIDRERWYDIYDKTVTSQIPTFAYYEPTVPLGTLKFWNIPSAGTTIHILTQAAPLTFALLTTDVTLPPGYQRAISNALAVELSPEFGVEPSPTLVAVAVAAKADIKRANIRPMLASAELYRMVGGSTANIEVDA